MNTIFLKKERRKRYARPISILWVGGLLCFLPVINFFIILKELKTGNISLPLFFSLLTPLQINLLLLPLPIGIGLLMIKKWAWWAILIYFPILIVYDFLLLVSNSSLFNFGVLFRTILGFGLIVFILRKNISAPYFKLYPRGWRGEKRNPIELDVILDDKEFRTKDVSLNGIYLDWKDCDKNLGDEVVLEFKEEISLIPRTTKAGIVRIDESGVGLAFRK